MYERLDRKITPTTRITLTTARTSSRTLVRDRFGGAGVCGGDGGNGGNGGGINGRDERLNDEYS